MFIFYNIISISKFNLQVLIYKFVCQTIYRLL